MDKEKTFDELARDVIRKQYHAAAKTGEVLRWRCTASICGATELH